MANYENPWTFDGKEFDSEDIGNSYGFVYIITTPEGQKYIGRKYFWSIRKARGKTRRQRSESDWKAYYGSSDVLKSKIKDSDKNLFRREIISLHSTKGRVNYEEVREQFAHGVLERAEYLNDNINGKWHRGPEHIRSKSRFSALASGRASQQDPQ
jgi:hypothetical protein